MSSFNKECQQVRSPTDLNIIVSLNLKLILKYLADQFHNLQNIAK